MPERVAVVGGGFAGLEVANRLADQAACEVVVFDRVPRFPLLRDPLPPEPQWDYPPTENDHPLLKPPEQIRRLGGRSLYYQGVMLEIEEEALAEWPSAWRQSLTGNHGMYQEVRKDLAPDFPYLTDRSLPERLGALGLQHVPQALRLSRGHATIYSPINRTLEQAAAGRITLVSSHARNLVREGGKWNIHLEENSAEETDVVKGFDTCVLAASAIGNAILLARSLHQTLALPVSEHIGTGAFAPIESPTDSLTYHQKLWHGYRSSENANIFVQEIPPGLDEDHKKHVLDVSAIIEHDSPSDSSGRLIVSPNGPSRFSLRVSRKITAVKQEILALLSEYTGEKVRPFLPINDNVHYEQAAYLGPYAYADQALFYLFPMGEFHHESQTTPLGWRSPTLTITEEAEVAQMPGVYIAGPGIFPRLGKANPALTLIATSRLLADWLSAN